MTHIRYTDIVKKCFKNIKNDIIKTKLDYNKRLSSYYGSNIFLKREDLQTVRSFKIRGAVNKIKNIDSDVIVTASAGNHAQGVAYSCNKLNKYGNIFVPETTPPQKIERIKFFGKENIKIHRFGKNFTQCLDKSLLYSKKNIHPFIHPFDDSDVINGQATVAYEIYQDIEPDIIISCVGGGGLISGISKYAKTINKNVEIYGVESMGAASLYNSLKLGYNVKLNNIDTFVDGASVAKIGDLNFNICKKLVDGVFTVSNERLCHELIYCYQNDGIILEPAGALSLCGLELVDRLYKSKNKSLKDKNIVCILSGGNNDISRYGEIMELNLKFLNLKHYFIMEFNQKPGELKRFITDVLGPNDDIVRFEYIKKTNKQYGNVLVGIELNNKNDLFKIIENLEKHKFKFKKIEEDELIYDLLI